MVSSLLQKLGFKKAVNGAGHFTKYGGSCPDPRVVKAMVEASAQWVDMAALEVNVGKMLSSILGCEDGIVTAGAYSSNVIAACAALEIAKRSRKDIRAPNIVIQRSHITKYAEAFRTNGIELKEVVRKSEDDVIGSYVDASTVAVAYVLNESDLEFSLPECVSASREMKIPVLVDAAVVDPPVRGIREVLNYGPDLVAVSGGKGFNGPNSSGLLLGRADPVAIARSLAFPNYGPGRGMKVSKEEIVGLMAAVQIASQQGDAQIDEWHKKVKQIQDSVAGIDSVRTQVFFPWKLNFPQPIPRLLVHIDTSDGEAMAETVRQRLEQSDPPIWTRPLGDVTRDKNVIVIDVRTLDKRGVRLLSESLSLELRRVLSARVKARA
jgi:seryl-tRNA(Sec) selenium transferase